jgi:hypothetical protein
MGLSAELDTTSTSSDCRVSVPMRAAKLRRFWVWKMLSP